MVKLRSSFVHPGLRGRECETGAHDGRMVLLVGKSFGLQFLKGRRQDERKSMPAQERNVSISAVEWSVSYDRRSFSLFTFGVSRWLCPSVSTCESTETKKYTAKCGTSSSSYNQVD